MKYTEITKQELAAEYEKAKAAFEEWKKKGISLDLTRGKPAKSQLDITEDMLTVLSNPDDCITEDGIDVRNYGILDGIPEAKRLFAELLGVPESYVFVGGNSSLNLMFDTVARAMLFGVGGGKAPWCKQGEIKFLCPAPGYDRHFGICEMFGIKMIPITMNENGPDMGEITEHIKDPSVKGMWCVPKFSNPDGIVYSDEIVEGLAAMNPAADDFRIFWDNAYAVHELVDHEVKLADIFTEARKYGNEDMIYMFASTSKISFPGSGLAVLITNGINMAEAKRVTAAQTIGFDKLNMLRHVRYFKNADGIRAKMREHAKLLKPKFDIVENTFTAKLGDLGIARWTKPEGGYFVSLYVLNGCAKRVYELCADAGVKLTKVGAAYPYGKDPDDSHLRIAPSFPTPEDLQTAINILSDCVKLAAAEKLLAE